MWVQRLIDRLCLRINWKAHDVLQQKSLTLISSEIFMASIPRVRVDNTSPVFLFSFTYPRIPSSNFGHCTILPFIAFFLGINSIVTLLELHSQVTDLSTPKWRHAPRFPNSSTNLETRNLKTAVNACLGMMTWPSLSLKSEVDESHGTWSAE